MDNFGPTSNPGLFLTVPNQSVGCPRMAPSSSIGSTSWNRNPWPFPASQHPKPFSWLFRRRISKLKKTPTSRNLSKLQNTGTHVWLLQWGSTLTLVSPGFNGSIVGKSREKVDSLSLKLSPSFPLLFFFLLPKPVGSRWDQDNCPLMPHVQSLLALRIFLSFYPFTMNSIHSQGAMCLLWPHT